MPRQPVAIDKGKLRLPSRRLDPEVARIYCARDSAAVRVAAGKVILSYSSVDEEAGDWVEGEGCLSSLISVRAELARGDLRALYLGWLLRAQAGELDDHDIEPPVPPGLGELGASRDSLAEFLRIDDGLLHVAADASPAMGEARIDRADVRAWIGTLPGGEKDDLLAELVVSGNASLGAELLQRFLKHRLAGSRAGATRPRTVGQLRNAAEAFATERRRIEAERRAEEKARRGREVAIAKEQHFNSLAGRGEELWAEVDSLVPSKQSKGYDRVVETLVDLRDLAARGEGGMGSGCASRRCARARRRSRRSSSGCARLVCDGTPWRRQCLLG